MNTEGKQKHSTLFVVLSWVAVFVMALVIFWMSAHTDEGINHGLGIISEVKAILASIGASIFGHQVDVSPVGHFTEFFIFGLVLFNALRLHLGANRIITLVVAVAIASLYGASDEIHQIFVPGRSCDIADWVVDTIAAFLGAGLMFLILKARRKASRK